MRWRSNLSAICDITDGTNLEADDLVTKAYYVDLIHKNVNKLNTKSELLLGMINNICQ